MFEIATPVGEVNKAFYFIFGVSGFFIIAITAVMIFFVFRYRKKAHPVAVDYDGHLGLEIAWTIIPLLLTMGMFWYGWLGFLASSRLPQGATEISAVARMYNWTFKYANGKVTPELYVPASRPIKLNLETEDVIHSLFIPAFRIKEDCVPGQVNVLTFTPLREGIYDIYCTEFCGVGHSAMNTRVIAMRPKEYELWYHSRDVQKPLNLEEALEPSPKNLERGKVVFETQCASCHGKDGQGLIKDARNFNNPEGWVNGDGISQIFRTLNEGRNEGMPSFAHLPVDDRLMATHYVRSFVDDPTSDTVEQIRQLDEDFNLSTGSDAPPEIAISEAMKLMAAEAETEKPTGEPLKDKPFNALAEKYPFGARLYENNCVACHGQRGEGTLAARLDEVFGSRLQSLALNVERPWRTGDAEAFHKRVIEVSEATGGVKPMYSTFSKADWEALYQFCLGLKTE